MHTDEEQLEDIKKWWKANGRFVIIGLAIGLAIMAGTRGWNGYQERQRLSASAEYDQFESEMARGDTDALTKRASYLIDNFGRTPYATLAALELAKVQVDRGDLAAAAQRLQWAVDHAGTPELVHIARLRLARVLAAQKETAKALALVEGVDPGAFSASYDELKGDLYVASGDRDKARAAYVKAIGELGTAGVGLETLKMKLDDLGAG
jgi:predicted negative regulator of RcsB-dependent stress response